MDHHPVVQVGHLYPFSKPQFSEAEINEPQPLRGIHRFRRVIRIPVR